jgi:hypothetical protein
MFPRKAKESATPAAVVEQLEERRLLSSSASADLEPASNGPEVSASALPTNGGESTGRRHGGYGGAWSTRYREA